MSSLFPSAPAGNCGCKCHRIWDAPCIAWVPLLDPIAIVTACARCKEAHYKSYFRQLVEPKPLELPKPYDPQADGESGG